MGISIKSNFEFLAEHGVQVKEDIDNLKDKPVKDQLQDQLAVLKASDKDVQEIEQLHRNLYIQNNLMEEVHQIHKDALNISELSLKNSELTLNQLQNLWEKSTIKYKTFKEAPFSKYQKGYKENDLGKKEVHGVIQCIPNDGNAPCQKDGKTIKSDVVCKQEADCTWNEEGLLFRIEEINGERINSVQLANEKLKILKKYDEDEEIKLKFSPLALGECKAWTKGCSSLNRDAADKGLFLVAEDNCGPGCTWKALKECLKCKADFTFEESWRFWSCPSGCTSQQEENYRNFILNISRAPLQ